MVDELIGQHAPPEIIGRVIWDLWRAVVLRVVLKRTLMIIV